MKRNKLRLLIPQHEFGFSPDTFNLFAETTLDGERIARERAEEEQARRVAESAPAALFQSRKPFVNHHPFRLRAGDVIRYSGPSCCVLRVTDSSAVVPSRDRRATSRRALACVSISNRNPLSFTSRPILKSPSLTADL